MHATTLRSLKCFLFLMSMATVEAKETQNLELKFGPDKTVTQTRAIKPNEIHDIFFRAKKNQQLSLKITSTGDTARFEVSAMFELDVNMFQKKTRQFSGKLPESGTGEYVIRVESPRATTYTLTATLK